MLTTFKCEIDSECHDVLFKSIKDYKVLLKKYIHQMAAIEECEQYYSNDTAIKAHLEQENLHIQNTSTESDICESHSVALTIAGEHVHHHIYEISYTLS